MPDIHFDVHLKIWTMLTFLFLFVTHNSGSAKQEAWKLCLSRCFCSSCFCSRILRFRSFRILIFSSPCSRSRSSRPSIPSLQAKNEREETGYRQNIFIASLTLSDPLQQRFLTGSSRTFKSCLFFWCFTTLGAKNCHF